MKLVNLIFSRNAVLCSFAAVVAAWVGSNVIPTWIESGGWWAAAAFLCVHGWNALLALRAKR
jgi:hypothetical protein